MLRKNFERAKLVGHSGVRRGARRVARLTEFLEHGRGCQVGLLVLLYRPAEREEGRIFLA